jgi:hypothetical protein
LGGGSILQRPVGCAFLSGWKKSNSVFLFPSDRILQIAADFQHFPAKTGAAQRVLESRRV